MAASPRRSTDRSTLPPGVSRTPSPPPAGPADGRSRTPHRRRVQKALSEGEAVSSRMTVRPDGGPPIDFIGRWRNVDLWAVEAAVVAFEWNTKADVPPSRNWRDAPWTFVHVRCEGTDLYLGIRTGLNTVLRARSARSLCTALMDLGMKREA